MTFNALPPIIDLNAALVSYALTGYDVFISAADHVGPNFRVDHDVSLLIPEVWCRMGPAERQPRFLIENGYFEKCEDIEFAGRKIPASRLGYRMTASFARTFFGRVFNHPHAVFTEEKLGRKPNKKSKRKEADAVRIIPNNLRTAGRNHIRSDTGLKGQKGWPAGGHQSRHDCFASYVTSEYV